MRPVAVTCVAALVCLGCGGDDDGDGDYGATSRAATSTTLDLGGLDLDIPEGFFPVPAQSAGFGLGLPAGWQVTLLTPKAVEALETAGIPDAAFVEAALDAAANGAILYGAGVAPNGTVTDVKVDVQASADPQSLVLDLTDEIQEASDLTDVEIEAEPGVADVRIRFTSPGPAGAESRAQGTQYLYGADDAVWSLIVTSKDAAAHDSVADAIADTFVLTSS